MELVVFILCATIGFLAGWGTLFILKSKAYLREAEAIEARIVALRENTQVIINSTENLEERTMEAIKESYLQQKDGPPTLF